MDLATARAAYEAAERELSTANQHWLRINIAMHQTDNLDEIAALRDAARAAVTVQRAADERFNAAADTWWHLRMGDLAAADGLITHRT